MLNSPYLRLLRIPNIFTIPSNIILGYFIAISVATVSNLEDNNHVFTLLVLITSSIFLYLGGLVSNDYFDEKIDSIERPFRPIPSGGVPKKNALLLLICLFLIGLSLSLFVGFASLVVSILLTIGILSYNYKIKNGTLRSYLMGTIRGLNILYGFSFLIPDSFISQIVWNSLFMNSSSTEYHPLFLVIVLVFLSMFFHVLLLTHISKREAVKDAKVSNQVSDIRKHWYLYLVYTAAVGISGCILLPNSIEYMIFILSYTIITSLIFNTALNKESKQTTSKSIQFLVKNMILMIILLDSVFIAGIAGYIPALLTSLLIFPPIILSKKFSMT